MFCLQNDTSFRENRIVDVLPDICPVGFWDRFHFSDNRVYQMALTFFAKVFAAALCLGHH